MSDVGAENVPPARNTGVLAINPEENYRYCVDWLRFSVPYWTELQDLLPNWDCFNPTGELTRPLPNYNRVMLMFAGRIDWNTERPEQKRLITFTGQDLQHLINEGYGAQELINHIVGLRGLKVSRLDFAADVHGLDVWPVEVYLKHKNGECRTRAKRATLINSQEGKTVKGQTCYVGTRESMKFLRVYDKAAESKSGERFWTRIEIELKDEYALVALKAMAKHGIIEAGKTVVREYITTGLEWFDKAFEAGKEGVYVDKVEHKETDWERWVVDVALPAVVTAMIKQVPGVQEEIRATLKQLYFGHGTPGKPKPKANESD